ncbi:MAG: putative NUDIX family phosphoesterase [Verrucomicrobiales bacterium]|jgi:predicted NUDIX family phosphoesterase
MSKYDNEHVLVVKRELFDSIGSFQGLAANTADYLPQFLSEENNYFMLRDLAEDDPSHKQIIPYAIFHHGGKFLHYVRGKKSGEQRLAAKGSIGIGGHINTEDAEASSLERDTYMTGVDREMNEELVINSKYQQRIVALLNDDSNEVGQVHLGVVHLFELESPDVKANEAAISELEFLSHEELKARHDRLETWSQICVDGFAQLGLD